MVPGHLWTQLGTRQHMGPLTRRGDGNSVSACRKGLGYYSLLCPRDTLPSREGRGFGTHTGTQHCRVLDKVPCRFLLSESKKVSDVWVGRHGGARVPGTVLSLAPGFSCPCGSHASARALWGEKGSEVPPRPLISSWESSSGPAPGPVTEGLVCR